MSWEDPNIADFLSRLASFSRVIVFDKRGTGMSDRVPGAELPTLEQRMDDVRAVMAAAESKRAALFGISEGGTLCELFAATYPEWTTALILFGSWATWVRDDDHPWAPTLEQGVAISGRNAEGKQPGWLAELATYSNRMSLSAHELGGDPCRREVAGTACGHDDRS